MLELVVAIREQSAESRIHFIGVLPRLVDNDAAKPFIVKFNRYLLNATDRLSKLFDNIKYLPVQLQFIQGMKGKKEYYNEDGLMLNEA